MAIKEVKADLAATHDDIVVFTGLRYGIDGIRFEIDISQLHRVDARCLDTSKAALDCSGGFKELAHGKCL